MNREEDGGETRPPASRERGGPESAYEGGEADLIAGETVAQVGAVTGEFPAPEAARPAARKSPQHGTGRGAFLVGAGILLSRVVGVVRQRVFAYFLGSSDAADAFTAAFR